MPGFYNNKLMNFTYNPVDIMTHMYTDNLSLVFTLTTGNGRITDNKQTSH